MKENLKNLKRTNKVNFWHIALISFVMIFAIAVVVNIRALATDEDGGETEEDSSNVTYVTTSDGYNIPVPEGFTASEVDGETNGATGFVIYEGDIDWNTVLSDTAVSDWNTVISGSSSGVSTASLETQSTEETTALTTESTLSTDESGIALTSEDETSTVANAETDGTNSENGSSNEETAGSETGESTEENTDEQTEIEQEETNASEEIENAEKTDEETIGIEEETQSEDSSESENTENIDSDTQNEQTEGTEENATNENDNQETTDAETSSESNDGISLASDEGISVASTGDTLTQKDINVLNLQTKVNQYVWVPVETPSRIYGVDSSGKLWGKLYSSWSTTTRDYRNGYWSDTNGVFTISESNLSSFLTSYREPDVTHYNTSYDIDSKLNSYLDGDTQYELLSKELEQSFYNIMQSIEKYGGFYIGRYETGGLSSTNSNTAVVRKMDTSISSVTWYVMYEQCKSLGYENDNVETSMIWGCLWDETLQWFLESGATNSAGTTFTTSMISSNSTTWGNYSNSYSLFEYYTTAGATAGTWETTTLSSSGKIPAGSADYTKVNNIYDMAGNVWDWTLEAYSTVYRVFRGGYYNYNGSSFPSSYRGNYIPTNSSINIGCRSVLYIK